MVRSFAGYWLNRKRKPSEVDERSASRAKQSHTPFFRSVGSQNFPVRQVSHDASRLGHRGGPDGRSVRLCRGAGAKNQNQRGLVLGRPLPAVLDGGRCDVRHERRWRRIRRYERGHLPGRPGNDQRTRLRHWGRWRGRGLSCRAVHVPHGAHHQRRVSRGPLRSQLADYQRVGADPVPHEHAGHRRRRLTLDFYRGGTS